MCLTELEKTFAYHNVMIGEYPTYTSNSNNSVIIKINPILKIERTLISNLKKTLYLSTFCKIVYNTIVSNIQFSDINSTTNMTIFPSDTPWLKSLSRYKIAYFILLLTNGIIT